MRKIFLITFLTLLSTTFIFAQQFDLSGELRPRYENKNGYQSLRTTNQDAANFISQRTRLNFDYKNDKLKFKVTFQNVRVWGDVGTLSSDDNNSALQEAWAEARLSKTVSLKLGRQEIAYDDHRIFGDVGWAQQARSHDAFLLKYKPNENHKVDIGLALNADNQGGIDNLYSNTAGYKTFQYAWYHGDFEKFGLSILALNTGVEYLKNAGLPTEEQVIDYMQTVGPRLTFKTDKFNADAAAYFQTGKFANTKVNASYFGLNAGYDINKNFSFGAGMEYLSGKDMNDTDREINSFAPLFGTNHKFNGLMDYFYVGNHGGSVGLLDISANVGFKKDKFSAKIVPHFFSAAADIYDGTQKMDKNLGTEIDFTMAYKLSKVVTISGGYSQIFGTESLEVLKGGDKDLMNSWGWLMFTFKPLLFTHKQEK